MSLFSVSFDTSFSYPVDQSFSPIERAEPVGRKAMKWVNFKEICCERYETRCCPDWAKNNRTILDRFTELCHLEERDLDKIECSDLERYVAERRKQKTWRGPISPGTINNEIATINSVFALAGPKQSRGSARKNFGWLTEPPYVEPLSEDDEDPVSITQEQKQFLLQVIREAKTPQWRDVKPSTFWRAAIVVGTVTSLRRGALLRVKRPSDHALKKLKILDVPADLSKTGRPQKIPLSTRVVNLLEELGTKPGELLLPWYHQDGSHLTLGYFTQKFREMQRDAGIPEEQRVLFKDLRSTAATELCENFGDSTAKKRLNHRPGSKVIDTNYKSKRISDVDCEASEFLTESIWPEEQLTLKLFGGDPAEAS